MDNKETKKINDLRLPQVVEKLLNVQVSFEELSSFDKAKIIKYINDNNLPIRLFIKIGFDVLKGKFFTIEYVYNEEYSFVIDKKYIDSFEEFYKYVDGKIYESSCYYGYSFNEEIINKYGIDIRKLNFNSFINDDISNYTFDILLVEKNKELKEKAKEGQRLYKSIYKIKEIDSYELLMKKYKYFIEHYDYSSKFFSLILQKFGESIKDYVITFIKNNGINNDILIDDIIFYYGIDTINQLLYDIDNGIGINQFINTDEIKKEIKEKITLLRDKRTYTIKKNGYYSSTDCLYIVSYCFYTKGDTECFIEVCKYFLSYEDFAMELEYDLSDANLEKAPIEPSEVLKYKTNKNTKLPTSNCYEYYTIKKYFDDGWFYVCQEWKDKYNHIIVSRKEKFEFFCDFVHYLKGDVSNSDFLLCEEIDNIVNLPNVNINGIKVRSDIAKKLNLELSLFPNDEYELVEFTQTQIFELDTIDELNSLRTIDDFYSHHISYVTDIHLLHKIIANKCKTYNDVEYVTKIVAKEIGNDTAHIKLIGGDIASDFEVYKSFINYLKHYNNGDLFITIGNHELWPFDGYSLDYIVEQYKNIIEEKNMFFVNNNLFYLDDFWWREITTEELETITFEKLRIKTRSARIIVFGGLGFAGNNESFNANAGIYRKVIDRKQEVEESKKFESLYLKVSKALYDKNVIILTHMPMNDWTSKEYTKGFVYVSGHNHKNYMYDDGIVRVYADNQIGYKQKKVHLKRLSINKDYDWFSDYKDGIYEITKEDYEKFYFGINKGIRFNREYEAIYMIKREKTYMFFMKSPQGKLLILDGGIVRSTGKHSLEYFYENIVTYSKSIEKFMSKYDEFQHQIAREIISIGGNGTIHGGIIDIDFYNHLFINPLDGKITPYFAESKTDKYVYSNLPSLLKNECPKLYDNYETKFLSDNSNDSLVVLNENLPISDSKIYVSSTEMYRVSYVLKELQYIIRCKLIRIWNDNFVDGSLEENGRSIVENIIDNDK